MNEPAEMTAVEPIHKQIVVPLSTDEAFQLFTDHISTWWPLDSHSVAGRRAVGCRFEPLPGGRLLEEAEDGSTYVWGTVETWDPPNKVTMSWHPGRQDATAQHLAVSFTAVEAGTRLDLVHSGWESLGDSAESERGRYQVGWDPVLQRLFSAAVKIAGAKDPV